MSCEPGVSPSFCLCFSLREPPGQVLYTSAYFPRGHLLENPATRLGFTADNGTYCPILIAGPDTHDALRRHCNVGAWRVVPHRLADSARRAGAGRRASRLVKILPHLFFPEARFTIFADWKLRLTRSPADLVAETVGRPPGFAFALFRHPCTTAYRAATPPCDARHAGEHWWEAEIRQIAATRRTAESERLEAQASRLRAMPGLASSAFPEGGLIVRDATRAATLSCAWRAEYARNDSTDRDQLALAAALAASDPGGDRGPPRLFSASTARRDGVLLLSEGAAPSCGGLCHWDEARTTAETMPKVLAIASRSGGVATRSPRLAKRTATPCAPGGTHWLSP